MYGDVKKSGFIVPDHIIRGWNVRDVT
jgi:hypothetical protein